MAIYYVYSSARYGYQVDYNTQGGSAVSSSGNAVNSNAASVTVNVSLRSTVPTRTGYTFKKWNTKADGTGTNKNPGGSISHSFTRQATYDSTTYDADGNEYRHYTTSPQNYYTTLYAQWEIDTYKVSYNKGTNGTGTNTSATKTYGQALTLKGAIFTRTGYTQTGWSTTDGGAKVYNLSDTYTANAAVTLYPYWTADTYTVSYKKGTSGSGTNTSDTKTYGVALTLKGATFTRTGYTQDGWATSDGGATAYALSGSYTANAGATLYPHWKANTYTVSYNANGGSGAPSAQTKTYGVALTLSNSAPTRSGFIFQGWATSATGAVAYQPGGSYTANAAATLYAIWASATSTVSTTNGTLGTAQTITITRSSTSYTHNLSYTYGNQTGSIATGVGASYSWTPPTSLASAFPNATSGVCTITCVTKSGNTTIGTSTTTCTLNIPTSIKPTGVSLTAAHYSANTAISGWGVFTRGYSRADLSVSFTLNGGATLSSVTFNGPGVNATGTATTKRTSVLSTAGTNTWTVTVTDSRGRSATATVSKTVYDYAPPLVSSIGVCRCDSDGTENNGSGTYMKFKPRFSVSSVNGNNGLATSNGAMLKWRVAGGSWSSSFAVTNNTWTSVLGSGNIDITKSYEAQLTVIDKVGNTTVFTVTLPSASGIWYGKGNDRIGLGGVPAGAGLYCDWDATFRGVLDVTNRRCYANLSSAGWYRVFNVTGGLGRSGSSFTITLHIGRSFTNTTNELHTVTLFANYNNLEFSSEVSKSNALGITKVRYTADGSNNGHIDIYYNLTAENIVYVNFDVHCRPENAYLIRYNAVTPTAVADSPSGETVVTEYTFADNTTINETVPKNSSFGASTFTCYARRRNGIGVVYLNVAVPATSSWSETTMCTMTTFKPSINMAFTVNGQGGSTFLVQFYTSGNITIWAPSATAAQFLRGSFVLFVD